MSGSADVPPLPVVLNAVRARIDAAGLRPTAREIGLDPKSVTDLLAGALPRRSTRQKLERWYVHAHAAGADPADVAAAAAALLVLTRGFGEAHRSDLGARLLGEIRDYCAAEGIPVPPWVAEVENARPATSE